MLTALPLDAVLGLISGGLVGFTLSLVGGGGSVLAVPLLVYLVGVPNPHVAIGSSAAAVAVNALMSLANHARARTIKWRCASVFAVFGVAGAFGGSTLGKIIDGEKLLALFALLMVVVSYLMLRRRGANDRNCLLERTAPCLTAAYAHAPTVADRCKTRPFRDLHQLNDSSSYNRVCG